MVSRSIKTIIISQIFYTVYRYAIGGNPIGWKISAVSAYDPKVGWSAMDHTSDHKVPLKLISAFRDPKIIIDVRTHRTF